MHGESYADCIFKAPEGLIPGCSDTTRQQTDNERIPWSIMEIGVAV